MIAIWNEIAAVEAGKADKADNVLKNAPHTAAHAAAASSTNHVTRSG